MKAFDVVGWVTFLGGLALMVCGTYFHNPPARAIGFVIGLIGAAILTKPWRRKPN